MNLRKILTNEYIFSVLTRVISIALGLLQSILIARHLGAAGQGVYTYILSIINVASVVITCGIHQAYPYFRRKYGKQKIYKSFVSACMVLFAAYIVASIILAFPAGSAEISIAIVFTPIYGYSNVVSYISLIENPNKRNKKWTVITIVNIVALLLMYVLMDSGTYTMLQTAFIVGFVEVVKSAVFTAELGVVPRLEFETIKLLREMVLMGIIPMLALLMTTLNYKLDVLMLRQYEYITAAQIGVYSIGISFADKIVMIPDTLKGVLVSKLAKGADESEVAKVCRLSFLCSILICIALMILGEKFITFLYGSEYSGAYEILIICGFGSVFVGYFKLIAQYNIVHKKQIRNILLLGLSVLINVILNLALIPKFQLYGAAIASGVGYFLSGVIFIVWFSKSNRIKLKDMFLIRKDDLAFVRKMKSRKGDLFK